MNKNTQAMLAALGVGKSADTGVATKTSTVNHKVKGLVTA